jgi:TRAP-type C4-dicarboxylate transport system permease small subunit
LKTLYRQAMEWLYIACIGLSGIVMLVMTKAHIAVGTLLNMLGKTNRARMERTADAGMAVIALFMIKWGVQLVQAVWHNTIAEFPELSVGVTYIPIPVAGVVMLLFVVERLWLGEPPADSFTFRDQPQLD